MREEHDGKIGGAACPSVVDIHVCNRFGKGSVA